MSSALILGHSFVRRMRDWLHTRDDLYLGLWQVSEIHYHGVGGATLYHLWDEIGLIRSLRPDVLLLDIGSNDLSYSSLSPTTFVDELERYVSHLLAVTSVREVVIFQVFYRASGYQPRRHQRERREYNAAVDEANELLHLMCKKRSNLHVFRLQGMRGNAESYLLHDGVHLNQQGQEKHKWHYRRAIIGAVSRLPPPSQYQ